VQGFALPAPADVSAMEPKMNRAPFLLAGVAALMGGAGVALAAAGVHANGGELAQRGALFLLLHAVAGLAIAAHARIAGASARALLIVGFVMEAGAILFSAELAMHVFTGERIFPFAAPLGGTTMILAWLALAVVFATVSRRSA
jgi:uncharacterized membrane protein YgdD (TMEM256/DUF423 family)